MKIFYYNTFINSKSGSRVHSRAFVSVAKSELKSNFKHYPSFIDEGNLTSRTSSKLPQWLKTILIGVRNLKYLVPRYNMLKSNFNNGYRIYARYDQFDWALLLFSSRYKLFLEVNSPMADEIFHKKKGFVWKILSAYEKNLWKNSSKITVVSKNLFQILYSYGVAANKMKIVPNGAYSQRKTEYFMRDTDIKVVFSGSVKKWHNLDNFIETLSRYKHKGLKFIIIGGDINVGKIYSKYSFVTHVPNIPQNKVFGYLQEADILVAPYPFIDNFYFSPLKIFEYMSFGKPIITTKVGQMAEILNEELVCYVDPSNLADLSNVFEKLTSDKVFSKMLADNCYKEFNSKYTWEHNFLKIYDFLKED